MGSKKHSTEVGVTRRIPETQPEAVTAGLAGSEIVRRDDECPAELRLRVLVRGYAEPLLGETCQLQPGQPTGVILFLDGIAVPILGRLGTQLRKCLAKGMRYKCEIINQEVNREGVHVTVLLVAA